jgi:hypothetical protein
MLAARRLLVVGPLAQRTLSNQVAVRRKKDRRGPIREWRKWRSDCASDRVLVPVLSPLKRRTPYPLGNREGRARQDNCHVVVPSAIGATLEVVEPEFVFEVFVDSFGPMAFLDQVDQLLARRTPGQGHQPEFAG